ncbi:tetratricopeptide repeat protein [Paracoccus luteus]|uniref:tetratricopeptide repeat protein n=1 Tax=Paracoccus luteus TaxID=2508543 RepID=UPI0010702D24|nr:hypothetical protein [Paracoccus luteus]
MTNQNDRFIDEVTEDLRRDRLFLMMRRYGWIVVLAILLVVAGTAWREWTQSRDTRQARAFGDSILAAEGAGGDPAADAAALAAVPAARPGQAALRDLLAGGAWAQAGDDAKAAAAYDAAAAALPDDVVMRDLARLKSVLAQGPAMDPAARDAALTGLSAPGAPFEMIALELKAIALVGAGRDEDAITLIRQIQQKDGLSEQMRRRLSELMITLGVDPEPAEAAQAPGAAAPMPALN